MLTGKLVRVRHARNKLTPLYLDPQNKNWLGVAEQLLFAFRDAPGRTRGELEAELADVVGDGPGQLVHQGLTKLLEDRCETEVALAKPQHRGRRRKGRPSMDGGRRRPRTHPCARRGRGRVDTT